LLVAPLRQPELLLTRTGKEARPPGWVRHQYTHATRASLALLYSLS
jgi:hypothetical protein